MSLPPGSLEPTLFPEGLSCHQFHKVVKRQPRSLEAFESKPLDGLTLAPDHQFLCGGIDTHIHILSGQSFLDVIAHIIEQNRSRGANFPHEMLSIDMMQPGIGINHIRQRW